METWDGNYQPYLNSIEMFLLSFSSKKQTLFNLNNSEFNFKFDFKFDFQMSVFSKQMTTINRNEQTWTELEQTWTEMNKHEQN